MARTKTKPKDSKPPVIPPLDAPALTKENFEKELKALASKAKEETWGKWATEQASVLFQSATLLTLAAVYSDVSQLTLSPVYGSYSSAIWHSKAVIVSCFVGWSFNLFIRRRVHANPSFLLPLIAAYIPMAQFILFKLSGNMGANFGPLITEALTLLPLIVISVACTATTLENLELLEPGRLNRFRFLADSGPGSLAYVFFKVMESYSRKVINEAIGASFIQTRLGLQILLAGVYTILAPSKLLFYAIPAVLHTALFNTHVPLPYQTSILNTTLNAKGYSLLERQESLTGYISIIESKELKFRVMRCDHSLLGGEWIQTEPNKFPEPVYSIFVQLEAIRLVEVAVPVKDKDANALVIGLGIGTTPAALMAHGINTTIVEIDPVVHDFATRYFALPTHHTAIIEDAVTVASRLATSDQRFDYIVHDVFTGGAEPVDLFTYEFLQNLHTVLKPGGVIALNYAGDLLLPSSRIVIATIKAIFPNCRIFREHELPPTSVILAEGRDFSNVMLFCTKSDSAVTFRKPNVNDFLGSWMREKTMMPRFEVQEGDMQLRESDGGVLRSNDTGRLGKWQERSAMGHWEVMRTVLPKDVWEDW